MCFVTMKRDNPSHKNDMVTRIMPRLDLALECSRCAHQTRAMIAPLFKRKSAKAVMARTGQLPGNSLLLRIQNIDREAFGPAK